MDMFKNVDLNDFWENTEYANKTYVSEPVTEELIKDIEQELGYKLPEAYIYLMKSQNGGIPKRTCCPSPTATSWSSNHVAIEGIYGIGRMKDNSLCGAFGTKLMIEEWGYPNVGIAICDCPSSGHDMIFLDYRECGKDGEPKVVHIDQEWDYRITVLAENFEEFISKLCYEEEIENR